LVSNPVITPAKSAIGDIEGEVYGGQQPVNLSATYLFAAGTTGYASASTSLLDSSVPAVCGSNGTSPCIDANGDYYVLTNANGHFSFGGLYTCVPGTQIYMTSIGGNSGAGTNTGIGLMAILGPCPEAGNLAATVPKVQVSEISTVAAAYAFAAFAKDSLHVGSSGTTLAQTGIANAFATAANLYNISGPGGGIANSVTPGGNGIVPQSEIDAIANSLAACINSDSASSPQCSTLFKYATSDGTTSGTHPTDTATAAINIARHPGGPNIAKIFNVASTNGPFAPADETVPNDLTLAITYTGGGLNNPSGLAVDASGNVWATNSAGNSVSELSPLGVALSTSAGFTDGAISNPQGIAIDSAGNVWVANRGGGSVSELLPNGTPTSGSPFSPVNPANSTNALASPQQLAFDAGGNLWVTNSISGAGSVAELSGAGTFLASAGSGSVQQSYGIAIDASSTGWITSFTQDTVDAISFASSTVTQTTDSSLSAATGIAIDSAGTKWIADSANSKLTSIASSGNVTTYSGGNLNTPYAVAVDGLGQIWVANKGGNSLSEFSSTGTSIPSTAGFQGGLNSPQSVVIDGSGNVWVASTASNTVTEFVGAAAATITPLVSAVANNMVGTQP
jgi:streptogramin lyase